MDKLAAANHVNYDPSDIMEQPLPGNRAKLLSPGGYAANYSSGAKLTDAGKSGQLSPGSDALGKEMKNYPSSVPLNGTVVTAATANQYDGYRGQPNASAHQGSQYKSKFLQQYDNNSVSSQSTSQAPYTHNNSSSNSNNNAMNHNTSEDVDGAFFGSLRGGDRSSGPGWNDDTSTNGFVSKPVTTKRSTGSRPRQQTTVTANHTIIDHASSHSASYADQRPSPRQSIQNSANNPRRSQVQRSDWNSGTEVMYPDPTPLKASPRANGSIVRVSPRVAGSRVGAPSAANGDAVNQARSNLSLLKSKIRRSESGNIIRNASSNRNSSSSDYANNNERDGSGAFQDRENRSAPSHNNNNTNNRFVDSNNNKQQQQPAVVSSNTGRKAVQASKQKHDQPPMEDEYRRTYPLQPQPKSRVPNYEQEANPSSSNSINNYSSGNSINNYSSGSGSRYQPSAAFDDPMDVPTDSIGEQLECPDCGRRFNPAPYERHVKICAKVFLQKRKVFDSTKMRTKDDPELAKLAQQALKKEKQQQQKMAQQMKAAASSNRNDGNGVRKMDSSGRTSDLYHEPPPSHQNDSNIAKSKSSKPKQSSVDTEEGVGNKSSKWKDQSKAFREAMRAARQVTQAIAEGKPLPPPVISAPDPSLIPCPHCGRRFSEKAAERHIPQCQNIKAKPSSLKRGSGGAATTANAAGRKVTGRGGF